jgi:hypothetical protein
MNRHDRKRFAGVAREMTTRILRREGSWEGRWTGFVGSMITIRDFAKNRGINPLETATVIGAMFARHMIDSLGAPDVVEPGQAALYLFSDEAQHRTAAQAWLDAHPAEAATFQHNWPDLDLLGIAGRA